MNAEPTPVASEPSAVTSPSVAPSPSTPDSGMSDWGTRLDSLFDQAEKGINPYENTETTESEPVEPKVEKTTKAKTKVAKTPKVEKTETKDEVTPEAETNVEEDVTSDKEEPKETSAEETAPANLTDKAKVKWGELKAEAAKAKQYESEIVSLKEELEKVKNSVPDTTEVERLKKINEEYETELATTRIEATQEYKSNVVTPMVNVIGYLNGLAEKYQIESKDILSAMAEADPSRQSDLIADIAASMNERDRLKFYAAADDYSAILKRRDFYQSSSKERLAKLEQQKASEIAKAKAESERTTSEAKAAYEKATAKVFGDLKKSVSLLSDEKVSSEVERLAKGDYTNANPELKAYLAHSGALLPHVLKSLKEAQANLEKANKTIASYRNGSPKAGSGTSDGAKAIPSDLGFLDALEQQLR